MKMTWSVAAIILMTAACDETAVDGGTVRIAEVANPELPSTSWVLGSPPQQAVVVLETARSDDHRRIGVRHRDGYGMTDGMALIGHAGPLDLDLSDMRLDYDVAGLDTKGRVARTWIHDGSRPERISTKEPLSAVLFLKKGILAENAIVRGSTARMMGIPQK